MKKEKFIYSQTRYLINEIELRQKLGIKEKIHTMFVYPNNELEIIKGGNNE